MFIIYSYFHFSLLLSREEEYPLIRRLFPQAEIQHIQGAGHWVHSEKPSLFIQVVNDFLKDAEL